MCADPAIPRRPVFRHILTNVGENLSDAEVTEAMAQFEVDAKGKISYEKAFGAIG